jgi:hypothetical protein
VRIWTHTPISLPSATARDIILTDQTSRVTPPITLELKPSLRRNVRSGEPKTLPRVVIVLKPVAPTHSITQAFVTRCNLAPPVEIALDTQVDAAVQVVCKRVDPLLARVGADKRRVVAVLAPCPGPHRVARVHCV